MSREAVRGRLAGTLTASHSPGQRVPVTGRPGPVGAAMAFELSSEATREFEAELARLREEHRDLDNAIDALERLVAGDQLQVQRLKKRKLMLRDRIGQLEDQLTPDIIA